jgi:hypothetical protein
MNQPEYVSNRWSFLLALGWILFALSLILLFTLAGLFFSVSDDNTTFFGEEKSSDTPMDQNDTSPNDVFVSQRAGEFVHDTVTSFTYPKELGLLTLITDGDGAPFVNDQRRLELYVFSSSEADIDRVFVRQFLDISGTSKVLAYVKKVPITGVLDVNDEQLYKNEVYIQHNEDDPVFLFEVDEDGIGKDFNPRVNALYISPNGRFVYVNESIWELMNHYIFDVQSQTNIIAQEKEIHFDPYEDVYWSHDYSMSVIKTDINFMYGTGKRALLLQTEDSPQSYLTIFELSSSTDFEEGEDVEALHVQDISHVSFADNGSVLFSVSHTETGEVFHQYEYVPSSGTLNTLL